MVVEDNVSSVRLDEEEEEEEETLFNPVRKV